MTAAGDPLASRYPLRPPPATPLATRTHEVSRIVDQYVFDTGDRSACTR
jgi:hypothetical protein